MAKAYHHVTQDLRSQIYALKSIGTLPFQPRSATVDIN